MDEVNPVDMAKYVSARRAVDYVEDGMRVGLGTGSTAVWMVRCLGRLIRDEGLRMTGVPTSSRTADLARQCGVPVTTLEDARWLDLTIDGADEVDGNLALIKGGGGALLHEKIVATASDRMVVIADPAKSVETLGAFPLPVEVVPFGWQTTKALIEESLGGQDTGGRAVTLRQTQETPFRTDEGNLILDLHLHRIGDPRQLALLLNQIPGVVENGLFIDIADVLVTGRHDGSVQLRDVADGTVKREHVEIRDDDEVFAQMTR